MNTEHDEIEKLKSEIAELKRELQETKSTANAVAKRYSRRGCEKCSGYKRNGGVCAGSTEGTCTWFRTTEFIPG